VVVVVVVLGAPRVSVFRLLCGVQRAK